MSKQTLTFDDWMHKVDRSVESFAGLSAFDLPDCPYRDWYDDELTPREAALKALSNARDEADD
jgi:hypothetical protein